MTTGPCDHGPTNETHQKGEIDMQDQLTTATWLWLALPMPLCVLLSLVSYIRHKAGKH